MRRQNDIKYTLYRRKKPNGDEVLIGHSFILLVWVVLAFVLIVIGRSLAGFVRWP